MNQALKVVAVLFFLLAAAATWDGVAKISAYREVQSVGREITRPQFLAVARNLAFTWLFAAIYASIGVGLWQRRKLNYVLVLLLASLVAQWMNVGYRNGFVLSFVALALLATPAIRNGFRP